MAKICVIYDSRDKEITCKLVSLLKGQWNVWWAEENISQGDWEQQVRDQISKSDAVVPVFSCNAKSNDIFKDELVWAKTCNRLIFPFMTDKTELPFGFGGLNRTDVIDWSGSVNHPGFQQFLKKIRMELRTDENALKRLSLLELRRSNLKLPLFVFSLSSYESQVSPKDGLVLLRLLEPDAGLISSYDLWKYYLKDRSIFANIKKLLKSQCSLFLDSGNYEASRKNDYKNKHNSEGWHSNHFREIVSMVKPDIAFAYDKWPTSGGVDDVTNRIIGNFQADERAIDDQSIPLCPIVHLPQKHKDFTIAECASQIMKNVVEKLDPVMIAIPERELGDGLIERVRSVLSIRKTLNGLGKYYPLHLLGTGNPISIIALAAAGADCFDGMEWCRTVVDYDHCTLFHFQHFDCFRNLYSGRLKLEIQKIIEDEKATYAAQVASYNLDFFTDLTRTMQNMINSGNVEYLLKQVPNISTRLFKEINQ